MKEKESESETIFIVKLKLNGRDVRTGDATQRKIDAFVRAFDRAGVEARLKAMNLPGTYTIEPAILCTEDRLTQDILRRAKLERFEFGFRTSDEATESATEIPARFGDPVPSTDYLPNCS
ncbi:MAG: hypothetical protein NUW08_02920 [Candidatus Uhrbacteria bacterium]|nr:hypothetical protein [Candidatus Uhrbacteria bacterium]